MITNRIDGVTKIGEDYLKTIVPPPKSIKVSLDDACQFKCGFCSRKDAQSSGAMEWGTFTKLVDEMVSVGIKELGVFFIGEPFLAKKLPDAIRYAKDKGIEYVFLTTNGAAAHPERVHACMDAGLDSLKFSFNYADGNQLRQIAGVSPVFHDKIIDNIKSARAIRDAGRYKCGVYASSIMLDGDQGRKMKEAVKQVISHLDEHYWLPLFSFGGQTDFGQPVRGNPGRLDNPREPLPCWSVFKEGHVTASGDISLCCFDSHKRWVVGNLSTTSFMEAWNSPEAQDLRSAHIKKDVTGTPCEHCAIGG